MTTAPLKVLLLSWDSPAPSSEASAVPVTTSGLVSALAPYADLTLLLPHLPEPMHLSALVQATSLGDLTAAELALTTTENPVSRLEHRESPAAPYLGATVPGGFGGPAVAPVAPAAPYMGSSAAMPPFYPEAAPAVLEEPAAPEAAQISATLEDETAAAEPAAPEAQDLSQPTADLPSDTASEEAAATPAPATAEEFPLPTIRQAVLDVALTALRSEPTDEAGLNFKVIQYARFATRLVATQDFAVIYASDWQSWLAGMEIRQLTGKPLVLHVHSLAQDRTSAADRGWIVELERMALRRADLVLTSSAALAMRVLELHELPPQRVRRLSSSDTQHPDRLADAILVALREVAPGRA
ncbi:glycosyltransferase [Hymenobacter psychrotolerans]|uniref:Glycosyl transferase 4-like domain-containing protein n=1 Tax=Hymenobacter psychrotolerans DSM 18569 TaxID=1121959 RepID=A0A1M6WSN6_9BACT|nr:glycosyltransferase [Hymenobacter psychrotolerans]SHK96664.1 Glycosyl transferase 4-like domain-containing protein [Hymenobacter psychrotolerans DSM 18569]